MSVEAIGPATRVGDLLDRQPRIREVFAAFHIGSQRGHFLPRDLTLAEVAIAFAIPEAMLVAAISAWHAERVTGSPPVTP